MNFPVNCNRCNQPLYGPVKFCPFCGISSIPDRAIPDKKNLDALRSEIINLLLQGEYTPAVRGDIRRKGMETGITEDACDTLLLEVLTGRGFSRIDEGTEDPLEAAWYSAERSRGEDVQYKTTVLQNNQSAINDGIEIPDSMDPAPVEEGTPSTVNEAKVAKPPPGDCVYNTGRETAAKKSTKPDIPSQQGSWKWVVIAFILVSVLVGYLTYRNHNIAPPLDHGKESARILALDAIRVGTDLSLSISKLPKLEKVRQAAQNLGKISPRYQDQVRSAESQVKATQNKIDKNLMSYFSKVLELSQYTPEQISYAFGVIRNGDLAPREKIVVELLNEHVQVVRNNNKADTAHILESFTKRFSNYVD